jgi:hypothetical protein
MDDTEEDLSPSARKLLGRWFFGPYIVFTPDALAAREIHQLARQKPAARGAEVLDDGRGGYWIRWRASLSDALDCAQASADTPACRSWPAPPWS